MPPCLLRRGWVVYGKPPVSLISKGFSVLSDSERKDKLAAELDCLVSRGCRVLFVYDGDLRARIQDFMGKQVYLSID